MYVWASNLLYTYHIYLYIWALNLLYTYDVYMYVRALNLLYTYHVYMYRHCSLTHFESHSLLLVCTIVHIYKSSTNEVPDRLLLIQTCSTTLIVCTAKASFSTISWVLFDGYSFDGQQIDQVIVLDCPKKWSHGVIRMCHRHSKHLGGKGERKRGYRVEDN